MKKSLWLLAAVLSLAAARADDEWVETFASGTLNETVPDGNPSGRFWELEVAGAPDGFLLSELTVNLNVSGGYNGDLYAYLSYNDTLSILLNRPGKTAGNVFGYSDAGFSLRFSDAAANDVHLYQDIGGWSLTGLALWQPDGRNVNPATVTDAAARTAPLSGFNGLNPNGTWTLFIADLSGGDATPSQLLSWSIDLKAVQAVPEPAVIAFGLLGGCALLAARRKLR